MLKGTPIGFGGGAASVVIERLLQKSLQGEGNLEKHQDSLVLPRSAQCLYAVFWGPTSSGPLPSP